MNTVKLLKSLTSPSQRKKRLHFGIKPEVLFSIAVGCLVATYLDLFFVGIGMYNFDVRPFPEIFSINLLFTVIVLPLGLFIYFTMISKVRGWKGTFIILMLSVLAAVFERVSETYGLFSHHENWKHYYTVIGYFVYLHGMKMVYESMKRHMK